MGKTGYFGAGLLGVALATTVGAAAPVAAAGPAADRTDCVGLLVPATAGGHTVEQRCGDEARQTRARAVLIVTYYEHVDLNQGQSGQTRPVYGGGPCDAAGYTFTPPSWWQTHMSSISVLFGQNCRSFRVRNPAGDTAQWNYSVMYMGTAFNDNVNQVKVWAS
ncbi:hypothetical protein GCM10010124_41100 [Pilimelia terevasa]|uniref:Secreted protein n=2 Tax=Pilimelia terevasa TaxID=53372 RepID=A0A8J3FLK5_9ACTN|nr:hypothetical protein GCM10010124_41100 [Pilimelia terevasa]